MSKAQREILISICVIGAVLALIAAACLWYTRPRAFSALLPNGGEELQAQVTLMSRGENGWDHPSFLLTPEQTQELVDRLSTTQYRADLAGNLFAAAAHTGKTELANSVNRMRLNSGSDYYNSGVLLMDLAAARREIAPEEIFRYVADHKKELLLPDQDLLNALYGRRILPLDDALWNYDARNYNNYRLRSAGAHDLPWVMEHTAILHFCGKAKPWKPGYVYRFGVLYHHYAQLARRACQAYRA